MKNQNFQNHTQIVYSYYITSGLPVIAILVLALRRMFSDHKSETELSIMFLLTGWVLLTYLFRNRGFALKAQDRAIRAEESLRHYILTGKAIDPSLTLGQVIALRFASDEELPALTREAVEKNLTNKEIKKAIRNWKADWHRV